ncbi:MAG: hypothetical protein KFF72_13345 [Arthrospira sp. SH-MAG29]|nr:hypothetical protein [Arthrospira sp. SH-MAG29]MBS0017311.1 hypothetical protein [Arthrospira sp. SH-MAG29]
MAARIVREACDRTRSNHLLRKGQGTRHSSHCRFEMLRRGTFALIHITIYRKHEGIEDILR